MKHKKAKKFVESQKLQLGLDDAEAEHLFEQAIIKDGDDSEMFGFDSDPEFEESEELNLELDLELKKEYGKAELKHKVAMKRLEALKLEEDLRNVVSENRVMAEFVAKLPEIASAMKIDRHTVIDNSGGSPLTYSLAQILTVLDEHGLRRFFEGRKSEEDAG